MLPADAWGKDRLMNTGLLVLFLAEVAFAVLVAVALAGAVARAVKSIWRFARENNR